VGSTTKENVLNWGCRLMQVDLCSGNKMVVCYY